jgi:hypothetical protein
VPSFRFVTHFIFPQDENWDIVIECKMLMSSCGRVDHG